MSVEHVALVLHHSRARGVAKLVLIGIANHEGDGGSFPAMGTLATYANIDVSGVRRHIRKLEALGEVRVKVNGGGTRHTPEHMRPNLYETTVSCPSNCDRTANHRLLCDVCNDPLNNARREAGSCKPGTCCPLSGKLAGHRCQGDDNRNHAPGLCLWPMDQD